MSSEVTDPPAEAPKIDPPLSIPWWTRGDTNAFFGLGFNILVNVLTLTGLMIGVIAVPAGDVLGTILPALGVALILGNLYYTFLARRLAKKENRTDVTALPYGPSVPHMFIVVFVVMLPVYLNTDDPMRAWQSGLAWAFMIGIIVMIGAFVGPYIRKLTPVRRCSARWPASRSPSSRCGRPRRCGKPRGSASRCWPSSSSGSSRT